MLIRLRSIGDTVLATPSLIALKRFAPDARVDILLEDWVAPVLDGFDSVDNVLSVTKKPSSRLSAAWKIRRTGYDVVFNLHGGTTGTFFAYASGAPHRVGYEEYQYKFLYNHLLSSSSEFWGREVTHSAEQQLALLGSTGVPVDERIKSRLAITEVAVGLLDKRFQARTQKPLSGFGNFVLMHPAAAFRTKQWAEENFAAAAEYLSVLGYTVVAVAAPAEKSVLERLASKSHTQIVTFDDLSLPEIAALAAQASLFVGNDSGIAHIAAAVGTPVVVVFGSSNVNHWRPWTDAPNEIVRESLPCQPCAGNECRQFGEPLCIQNVTVAAVTAAIDKVLSQTKKRRDIIPAGINGLKQES